MKIKLITDYKKGQKFLLIEENIIKRFGRNHGLNCDSIMEFIEVYSSNRETGHFKTESGEIITLKASDVKEIESKITTN